MGIVLLLATFVGLLTYALVLRLPGYSPRQLMIRRLRPAPAGRPGPTGLRLSPAILAAAGLLLAAGPWLLFGAAPDWAGLALYPALGWVLPVIWQSLQARRRSQHSPKAMAAATVILLLNGLLIYFAPMLYDLSRTVAER
ncbi:MAG TPA: hypothetical protein VD969_10680 [Symbiobacteriaceae bacterium]|nr:hypothetical protein [Symbiobacteriaceae bacterium]